MQIKLKTILLGLFISFNSCQKACPEDGVVVKIFICDSCVIDDRVYPQEEIYKNAYCSSDTFYKGNFEVFRIIDTNNLSNARFAETHFELVINNSLHTTILVPNTIDTCEIDYIIFDSYFWDPCN